MMGLWMRFASCFISVILVLFLAVEKACSGICNITYDLKLNETDCQSKSLEKIVEEIKYKKKL